MPILILLIVIYMLPIGGPWFEINFILFYSIHCELTFKIITLFENNVDAANRDRTFSHVYNESILIMK